MDLITQKMRLIDVNPELAKSYGESMGIEPDAVEFVRKGLVSETQFEDGEHAAISYITTNSIDRDGEIVEPSGADLEAYRKNPVVLFGHNYQELPIGKNIWIKQDEKGLIAKTVYASHDFAQTVYNYRKEGFPLAQSIGFIPIEWEDSPGDVKGCRRRYRKWALLEYSDVPVPANPEAVAVAISKGLIKPEYIPEPEEKAGRVLSSKNRTLIMAAMQQMDEASAALRDLLNATEPEPAAEPSGETVEMAACCEHEKEVESERKDITKADLMEALKDAINSNRVDVAGAVNAAVARKFGRVTLG